MIVFQLDFRDTRVSIVKIIFFAKNNKLSKEHENDFLANCQSGSFKFVNTDFCVYGLFDIRFYVEEFKRKYNFFNNLHMFR